MESTKVLNVKIINILIACLISLFVVFPDITLFKNTPARSGEEAVYREYRDEPRPPREPWQGQHPRPPRESPPHSIQQQDKPLHGFSHDRTDKIITDYVFFFTLSIILLFLNTYSLLYNKWNLSKKTVLAISIGESLFVCISFIILYTFIDKRPGIFPVNGMNAFKVFFIGLVSFLFVYVMLLITQQQKMALENEQLKSENLLAKYNVLTTQINPHFFFNSLNSLSSLIREKENEKSLKYINELSDIFRYILKSNKQGLTTLREELDFLQAYRYMLEIRYEGKLYFNIKIDDKYLAYQIPMLSAQLLIENVIKHNEISDDRPLNVDIYTSDDNMLVISNRIQKKIEIISDSGVGLQNLNNRYLLLVSKSIIIENDNKVFTVKLPLTKTMNE